MLLKCPQCDKTVSIQPQCVVSWFQPKFTCKFCKFTGKLKQERTNPK